MKKQFEIFMICALLLGSIFSANANDVKTVLLDENCEEIVLDEMSGCQINAWGIEALDAGQGSSLVTFRANVSVGSNSILSTTTFELRHQGGGKTFLAGHYNASGNYVESTISLSCQNPVTYVIFHANARPATGRGHCYDATNKAYPSGLCPQQSPLFNGNPDIGTGTGLGN